MPDSKIDPEKFFRNYTLSEDGGTKELNENETTKRGIFAQPIKGVQSYTGLAVSYSVEGNPIMNYTSVDDKTEKDSIGNK